jgi:hypothetical protein
MFKCDVTLSETGVLITNEANIFQGVVYQTVDHNPPPKNNQCTSRISAKFWEIK